LLVFPYLHRSSLIYFTNSTHPPSLNLSSFFIFHNLFSELLVSSHKSQKSQGSRRTKCRGNHQVLPWRRLKWLIVSISKWTRKLVFLNLVLSFSKLYACTYLEVKNKIKNQENYILYLCIIWILIFFFLIEHIIKSN
jgi:hypothetical protein